MKSKVLEFKCRDEDYTVSICESIFYPNYLGFMGILEIGYGKPIITKNIVFGKKGIHRTFLWGLIETELVKDNATGVKHSYSFVKEFITELEKCIKERGDISDDDLISFKPISESRVNLFYRLLYKNGWNRINAYDNFYYKNTKCTSAFFEQIKIFGQISLRIN